MPDNDIKVIICSGIFNVKTSFDFCIAVPRVFRDWCIPFVYVNIVATPAEHEAQTATEIKCFLFYAVRYHGKYLYCGILL